MKDKDYVGLCARGVSPWPTFLSCNWKIGRSLISWKHACIITSTWTIRFSFGQNLSLVLVTKGSSKHV